jgi:methylglyoxal synthase
MPKKMMRSLWCKSTARPYLDIIIIATANTGKQIQTAAGLTVELLRSLRDGGDIEVVDGEIIGTTPVELACIPGGLTLFAPLASNLSSVYG